MLTFLSTRPFSFNEGVVISRPCSDLQPDPSWIASLTHPRTRKWISHVNLFPRMGTYRYIATKEGATMIDSETATMTALDIYRGIILGLIGLFFGFVVFLMFL